VVDEVARLLADQDGVVGRRQLEAAGVTPTRIARILRRGELHPLHAGVYVEHNGPPTWVQRAWGGVVHAGPGAALCLGSALRAAEGPGRRSRPDQDHVVHVAVSRGRRVVAVEGVAVHRYSGLEERVQWNLGPPRLRYDDAVLDVAAAHRDDLAAVATLAEARGGRRTTAARLQERLSQRARIRRRDWLGSILEDVAAGTCSVLEHGYQARVVRPHGLPPGELQAPATTSGRPSYRDVLLRDLGLVVELDGLLHHASTTDRHHDLTRDLEAASRDGLLTVRLSYGQVFADACRTASLLGGLLSRRGWGGRVKTCPQCGTSGQPG